jgi:hypothetical protein
LNASEGFTLAGASNAAVTTHARHGGQCPRDNPKDPGRALVFGAGNVKASSPLMNTPLAAPLEAVMGT